MRILGDAPRDKNNGSKRVFYECSCGYIGSTRAVRAKNMKWCQACARAKSRIKTNSYRIVGDLAFIDVSTDKFPAAECVIDSKNIALVLDGKGRWFAANFCTDVIYAVRNARGEKMHRLIMNAAKGVGIDHADGDGLNNVEANLTMCGQSENMKNLAVSKRNRSGVIGVSQDSGGKWTAQGGSGGKHYYLGRFENFCDALKARKKFEADHGFSKITVESGGNHAR